MKLQMKRLSSKKILLVDLEISPSFGAIYGKYEQNVLWFTDESHMFSFSYKWLHEKKTHVHCLPDFKLYKKQPKNDFALTKLLWDLFDEADVIIAHNGDRFDIKVANLCFIKHCMKPPSQYKTIDTLKIARNKIKLNSNKLGDIGEYFGLGSKVEIDGRSLAKRCLAGDMKAWKKMAQYNKQDVVLLEKIYLLMLPWITNHPYMGHNVFDCPNCGGEDYQFRGWEKQKKVDVRRLCCKQCGTKYYGERVKRKPSVILP